MLYKPIALATIVGIMAMPANVATPKTDLKELDATDDVAKNAISTTETGVAEKYVNPFNGCGTQYWKLSSVSAHTALVKLGKCKDDTFKFIMDLGYFFPNTDAAMRAEQGLPTSRDWDYPFPSCEDKPMTKFDCEQWAKKDAIFSFKYGNWMEYMMPKYNMNIRNKYNPPGCFVVTANNVVEGEPSIFWNSLSKSEVDPAYGCSNAKLCVCPHLN